MRPRHELLRLAIPRRVYTQSHIDYLVEAILEVNDRRHQIRGFEIVSAAAVPAALHRQIPSGLAAAAGESAAHASAKSTTAETAKSTSGHRATSKAVACKAASAEAAPGEAAANVSRPESA